MMLVGADPEMFAKRNGEYVSAHGMVKGTKAVPFPVENGAVQVDGMALEFNIDPAEDEEGFVFNIQHVMAQLKAMVPDCEVVADPVARFTEAYLSQQPPESLELGCEPDFNAWNGKANNPPDVDMPMRTGAGHVHVGWTAGANGKSHLGMCSALVKQLDFYLGLPSLLFDSETERRDMYGKAGAFRPKPYGVEYRVLSNKWLSNEHLIRWVYRSVDKCFKSMSGLMLPEKYGDIQEIINTSDVDGAWAIINAENLLVPEGI